MGKVKTADVRAALDARYHDEAWMRHQRAPGDVLLHEVPSEEGRSADAVLVRCWKSRGYELHGFEIKVSRSDWLRELKAPEKAEPIARYMNRWFIVAPAGVVKADELPSTWGLMQYRADGKLVVAHPAPKLSPAPVDRAFLAILVRRAFTSSRKEIREAEQRARQEGIEIGRRKAERESGDEHLRNEVNRLKKDIADFEEQSGISFTSRTWHRGRDIGDALEWIMRHQYRFPSRAVDQARSAAERVLKATAQLENELAPLLLGKGQAKTKQRQAREEER